MCEVPVLFIIFNRPDETKKVFDKIKEIKPKSLFIAADGPRSNFPNDYNKCSKTREIILKNIDWDCDVKTLFSDINLGCGYGPKSAISWFFEQVDEGIILEDDCVPDNTFFEFCKVLLEKYRYDEKISIISGSNFDREGIYSNKNEDYFFSVIPYTWGWATWKRNWEKYDYEIKRWRKINKKKLLDNLHENIEHKLYWRKIFDDIYNSTPQDIWDYQFFFSCFLQNQLAIIPSNNLISNIGHNFSATHTINPKSLKANIPRKPVNFPLKHPKGIKRNFEYDNYLQATCYGKIKYVSLIKKVKRFIKRNIKIMFN